MSISFHFSVIQSFKNIIELLMIAHQLRLLQLCTTRACQRYALDKLIVNPRNASCLYSKPWPLSSTRMGIIDTFKTYASVPNGKANSDSGAIPELPEVGKVCVFVCFNQSRHIPSIID
jgi:hypothetical protein